MPRSPFAALLLLTTVACHRAPASIAGLNPDDAAQLNNAADMLDTSADDLITPGSRGEQVNRTAESSQ